MIDVSTPHFLELLRIISGSSRYNYYTEMHHGQAIIHRQRHLEYILGLPRSNVIVQLGGSDPRVMADAAKILQDKGYQEVNINVGCPSPRVQHGQFGAVLMKSPDQVAAILSAMTTANVSIPVTVKCRLGVDDLDSFEFLHRFVDTLVKSDRSLPHLIVHSRKCLLKGLSPKQNRNAPPLDYERVFRLARAFPELPITINGELNDVEKIRMALDNVDGCMIGRKIRDSPLFLQTLDQEISGSPSSQVKSVETIIHEYIDYAESVLADPRRYEPDSYRPPPITILLHPLMALYGGSRGRAFRRELSRLMKKHSKTGDVRYIVSSALHLAGIENVE